MVTSLGKELRLLRLNRGELLKDMAGKLTITPAYLSSIENGKKTPPRDIVHKIVEVYGLSNTESETLIDAYALTLDEINIQLEGTSEYQKQLGLVFARRFNDLTDEQISDILKTINGKDD